MELLYTITSYPPAIGGAQIHTHELVKGSLRQIQSKLPVYGIRIGPIGYWEQRYLLILKHAIIFMTISASIALACREKKKFLSLHLWDYIIL